MKTAYVPVTVLAAAVVLVVAFASRDPASGQEKPAAPAAAWEYKVVTKLANHMAAAREEAEFNKLGGEGWELAATTGPRSSTATGVAEVGFVFKRPKR
jgi:hypothetical protein